MSSCFPVVECVRSDDDVHLYFKCKWCGKVHYHGVGIFKRFGGGDGHRASHCSVHTEDYYLKEVRV